MENTTRPKQSLEPIIYTLAQSGTSNVTSKGSQQNIIVYGNGTDVSNKDAVKGKAKRKLITQKLMLAIIKMLEKQGETKRVQGYRNAYYCHSNIIQKGNRTYGAYCKTRYCLVCCANRKAKLVNDYLPIVEKWEDPHFLVLTVKSVKAEKLAAQFKKIKKILKLIIGKHKKRHQRKKTLKLEGIYTIECNYNPVAKTYNPHVNIITKNRETAYIIFNEWHGRWNEGTDKKSRLVNPKVQFIRRVASNKKALIEIIKYSAKIFTDPNMTTKGKRTLPPMIYAAAMDNIFSALPKRILERFGFNSPKEEKQPAIKKMLDDFEEFTFDKGTHDWLNYNTGELLTGHVAGAKLQWLLNHNIDTTST